MKGRIRSTGRSRYAASRAGWRDVGSSWFAAVVLTTLLLLTL